MYNNNLELKKNTFISNIDTNLIIVDINTLNTPLPKKKLFIIMIILISEISSLIYILPYISFMIQNFGIEEKHVGYYSGIILSSYMVGQFISNIIWGYISEKIGLKPVMLIGLFSSCIFTIIFGLAKNIELAIIIRLFHGLSTGNLGVTKTYLYLVTDKSNEVKAFSIFPIAFSIGSILAPAIGGLLETPSKYINLDKNNILNIYPYFLPSIVISLIPFLGFIYGLIYLEEVNNKNKIETNNENISLKNLLNKNIILCSYIYFNIRFTLLGNDNLYPLILSLTKKNKGVELNTINISIIYIISAIYLIFYSLLVIPKLKQNFGLLKLFKITQYLTPFLILLQPILSNIRYLFNDIVLSIIAIIILILKANCTTVSIILINIMINNLVEKKYLCKVNGFTQSIASLGSIFGPIMSTVLFSWSLSNKYFPIDIHFSYIILSIYSLQNIIAVNYLDNYIENRLEN